MPEFMETLEVIRDEAATVQRMFSAADGQRAPSRAATSAAYQAKVAEAAAFLADVVDGKRGTWQLREAFTTSDFPILFGDILDRQVLAEYRERIPTWEAVAKRRVVRDFRGVKLYKPLTGYGGRLEQVGELSEYPEGPDTEQATQTITVAKYGKRMGISWETLVNDDLDLIKAMPAKMARMARRTESYMATELYVDASGPHASLYTVGNANIVNVANGAAANNPPLSVAGLTDALLVFGNQQDEDGNPIEHEAVTLVVPPALEVTANNIVAATSIELTTDGGTTDGSGTERRLLAANWLSRRVRVVVNPLIPLIAAANGNTSWWLFASPGADREALVMAFLRGWEEPSVFIKSADARRVGGGEVDPMDGDFDTDAVTYKVRHVIGSARVDPKATVASNGTNAA
jgi:hypothetical protein